MASLKEIMNVDDDHAENPQPVKRVLEPGPRPPHGPETSFPSRSAFSTNRSTIPSLATNRSPSVAYPQTARLGSSPSPASLGVGSDLGFRRRSNASADSMDSYHGHTYLPDRTAMRPNLPTPGGQGETPVKLTPVTGRVSKAKKGLSVHECDICQPPKSFTRAEHLRRHQLSHNPPELVCPVRGCDKAFHREDLLKRHQTRHEQEQQLATEPQPTRIGSSDAGSVYGSSTYPSMVPQSTAYGASGPSSRSGSGPSTSDTSWPSRSLRPSVHDPMPSQHQYSLGGALVGSTPGSTLVSGYDQPRSSPPIIGTVSSLHTPDTGPSSLRWPDSSVPTSSSSSAFSTAEVSRLSHLPSRSLADEWVSHMPLAGDTSSAGTYSSIPFSYDSTLADSMGLPLPGYHDDASLYGSRDYGNSTVRSLSPPHMAVAQSSETLVTAPTPLSTDRLIQPACQGWQQGFKTSNATPESLHPLGLTQAVRQAIPSYLGVFWERVAPNYPIVHRSSLEVAVTIPEHRELLACAMAAVATQYLDNADARIDGSQLHAYAWNKAKTFTKSDPWPLPIQQTMILCEYFARYRGRKKGAHIASPHFARLYQMMNDIENTYAPIPSDGSVEQRWRVWIDMETRRRVLAACFLLDVHSLRYLEQPPTRIRGIDYTTHSTLEIPLSSGSFKLWEASKAKDWRALLNGTSPTRTLASITLRKATRSDVAAACRFDRAVILAGFSLQLPQRRTLTKIDLLKSPKDTVPLVMSIASLFPDSGAANTHLALQHTPLHTLLSVSGDSWVFNNKVPDANAFAGHHQQLRDWKASGSAAVATVFAARALKAFLSPCIRLNNPGGEPSMQPNWTDLSDYWGYYACTLICWASGSLDVEPDTTPFSLTAALHCVNKLAQLRPAQVPGFITGQHARQVAGLGHRLLMKDGLGGRSILLADAVNVLRKLDEDQGSSW